MTSSHHDHPEIPSGVDPADLDLYALDALPEHESDAIEDALISASAEQQASMRAHIVSTWEVAADLVAEADLDTAPPAALRSRVLEQVAAQARQGRAGGRGDDNDDGNANANENYDDDAVGTVTSDQPESEGSVVDLSAMRERRRPRTWTTIGAAAAAILLVTAGVAIGRFTDGAAAPDNLPSAAPATNGEMPDDVSMLLASDDLEIARGQVGGTGLATVLASRSADMAVISMTGLPEPDEGRAYQLWLMGDHEPIPAGTMEAGEVGPAPAAQIEGIRGSAQIGITDEPAGGSPAPTGQVLLALDLD